MNIKDIARMAGVSISTISRVINKSAYVSPEITERIERILDETGYRPNALAKELLRKKTNTIGVMLPRIDLGTFAWLVAMYFCRSCWVLLSKLILCRSFA